MDHEIHWYRHRRTGSNRPLRRKVGDACSTTRPWFEARRTVWPVFTWSWAEGHLWISLVDRPGYYYCQVCGQLSRYAY